jgi:quercetin dioxygenase-like cupin family protein
VKRVALQVIKSILMPRHRMPTFDLVVDGTAHRLVAGDIFPIPGNSIHSGEALTDCRILDVFSPVREDYRAG